MLMTDRTTLLINTWCMDHNILCKKCVKVRASVVAVTLDLTEEELFFQFGMDNWSAYVDQVIPCFPYCLSLPCCCQTWNQCMHVRTHTCVLLLASQQLLHVDARVAKLAMFCLRSSQSTVNGNAEMWLFA